MPRGDGGYVLGASVEERGFDTNVTAGAIYELLRDASELVPGLLELEIEEIHGRAAPGQPRQPAADRCERGRGRADRRAAATTATAILLAPLTAALVRSRA